MRNFRFRVQFRVQFRAQCAKILVHFLRILIYSVLHRVEVNGLEHVVRGMSNASLVVLVWHPQSHADGCGCMAERVEFIV